jgi:hypothetical protein
VAVVVAEAKRRAAALAQRLVPGNSGVCRADLNGAIAPS